jgi:hypothetical protein
MTSMVTDLERARMRLAGYIPPTGREGCRTCVHSKMNVWVGAYSMRCKLHKIPVRKLGWCKDLTKEVRAAITIVASAALPNTEVSVRQGGKEIGRIINIGGEES